MLILIFIINTGDRVLVERYYKNLNSEMHYVAFCILKDDFEAETAVQEAFIRIMERMDNFRDVPEERKAGYCFVAVRNVSLDLYRKAKRVKAIVSPIGDGEYTDESENIENMLIRQEDISLLRERMENLAPEYKRPLILRFAEDMRYKEIATLLGISEELARKRVQRAISQLSQQWEEASPYA